MFGEIKEEEYRKYWGKSPYKTFLSSPEIGVLREKEGWKKYFLGLKKNNELKAATMIVARKSHFGKYDFYAPRGFLLDYNDRDLIKEFTDDVKKFVKEHKGYEFRIDPYVVNVERDTNAKIVDGGKDNRWLESYLEKLGYKKISKEETEQVIWMYALDTKDKSEDDMMKNMKPNTRNTIRKALKNGIEIDELRKEDLGEFFKIMEETGKRKGFNVRNLKYYENMYDLYKPKDQIKFLIARLSLKDYIKGLEKSKKEAEEKKNALGPAKYNDGKRKSFDNEIASIEKRINSAKELKKKHGDIINLSGSMFILTKPEVIYLSSGNYDEFMNFNAQYLIQWEMIKYAVNNKYDRYNFYGISGNFDKNDKDYGIYEFKTGFNGYVEELIGEYAYPTSFVYYIMKLIHKIRK